MKKYKLKKWVKVALISLSLLITGLFISTANVTIGMKVLSWILLNYFMSANIVLNY